MKNDTNASSFSRVFGPILFLLLMILCATWFLSSVASLISELQDMSSTVTFSKGAMYMFGASISSFSLFVGVFYHSLYSRKVPENLESILMKGVIAGILIMFLLPQVVHFLISGIIDKHHYVRCQEVEYNWLLYKKYVYTDDEDTCVQLINIVKKDQLDSKS